MKPIEDKKITASGAGFYTFPERKLEHMDRPIASPLSYLNRFTLSVDRHGIPIGKFVYGKQYLARLDAVPFDPIELKLTSRVYTTTKLDGVFGVLRAAGPDYWGRRVIERHADKPQLNEIDYLLYSPDDRAGALGFGLWALGFGLWALGLTKYHPLQNGYLTKRLNWKNYKKSPI